MQRKADQIRAGNAHLARNDPVMRRLIRQCPPITELKLETDRFAMLVRSILSQQVSIHAARAIRRRLEARVGPGGLTPEGVGAIDVDGFRAIGVSRPKAAYLADLSERVASGGLRLNRIGRLRDAAVVEALTAVRGIGVWTAQMFLIFSLGRLDVFPYADHGVRSAIRNLYGLDALPTKAESEAVARPWRPYATIATWYLWRSHELERSGSGGV